MKLLIIIHNQVGTGPFSKVFEMCIALTKLENEVTLVCTSKSNKFRIKEYINETVNVIECPDLFNGKLRQGLDLWNTFWRYLILRKHKYDLIHAIDCRPVVILPSLALKRKLKIPLVLSWWDLFGEGGTMFERSGKFYAQTLGSIEAWFETYFRKYADGATVISTYLESKLLELDFPKDRIKLIRVGSFINESTINKSKIRIKLGFSEEETVMCFLGTLFNNDKKMLLQSLEILKFEISNLPTIVLIGNHDIQTDICQNLNIRLTGYLETKEEVEEYLAASDFGLLPMKISIANRARWPSKVTDYWRVGLPLITTPVSDFVQIYKNNSLGLISDSDSPLEYALTISKAIELSKEDRNLLSKNTIEFFAKEIDWSVIAIEQNNLYKSLLKL